MKIKEIYDYIVSLYPLENASSFDLGKVGLQFGSFDDEVKGVLVALDTTMEVVDYAIEHNINLIISHHPFMFQPLVNLKYDSPFGKKLLKVFQNRINIMAFHTNYDVGFDGMNDALAKELGLKEIKMLEDNVTPTTFVRLGKIAKTKALDFLPQIKSAFKQKCIKVAGDINRDIETIAIVGGAGASDFYDALASGADLFITGQIPHHLGLEALDNHFIIVEVSHAVEFFGVKALFNKLKNNFIDINWTLYEQNYDPFLII